jgi:hypothetical protein
MRSVKSAVALVGFAILITAGIPRSHAQHAPDEQALLPVADPVCTFFGPEREASRQVLLKPAPPRAGSSGRIYPLSAITEQVASQVVYAPVVGRASDSQHTSPKSIDAYLFADMQAAGVTPAPASTDWEFARRVTLDLTGRIPAPARVLSFVNDSSSAKRAALIDELLNAPEWVDKWTMYFGDLYKNTRFQPSSSVNRFPEGRNAFYQWIHDSLAAGKPYNQMATELITASGANSYQDGPTNWLVGGVVGGGPVQDITDQQAANVAETFLGISHMNCLLCHNGRGHLDAINLWAANTTRAQAWQFASFLSRMTTTRKNTDQRNVYYWTLADNAARDYTLGSTTGNRPARTPLASCAQGKTCTVAPVYPFTGDSPQAGENYRAALAREVTNDPQFARAAVNYIWAQFFGRGIVDPPNTFDPARLDPNNAPPAPWALQPADANLLNALAQRFIDSGYSLKALMREIANSQAYQLSSRYNGEWNPAWEPLFARKFVRRLWAEEIHDAVVQSSGVTPSYKITSVSDLGFGNLSWAMQFPDTVNTPGGGVTAFLDSFLRPNRDDIPRGGDGSVLQALNLMNDNFLMSRTQAAGPNANLLLKNNLNLPDQQLVNGLFLGVLSRYPTDQETAAALAALKNGDRTQSARNLLWSLYNKVDFVFNY